MEELQGTTCVFNVERKIPYICQILFHMIHSQSSVIMQNGSYGAHITDKQAAFVNHLTLLFQG